MEPLKGISADCQYTISVLSVNCVCRFLICVPVTTCKPIAMYTYHPQPSMWQQAKDFDLLFEKELLLCTKLIHPLATAGCFYFPERRLIQYDCGRSKVGRFQAFAIPRS